MFYTYLWLREDGTPYYVGKGCRDRAYTSHAHSVHKPKNNARIFVQFWESEEKAFEMEKWYIAFYGRLDNGTGILRNFTDGGDGPSGKIHSEATRRLIAASKWGNKNGVGNKSMTDRIHSPKTIEKMSKSHQGFHHS